MELVFDIEGIVQLVIVGAVELLEDVCIDDLVTTERAWQWLNSVGQLGIRFIMFRLANRLVSRIVTMLKMISLRQLGLMVPLIIVARLALVAINLPLTKV